ncbi:MAG: aldehyde dehydrogenase family protein, partial [Bacteroidota bacterium]
MIFKSINPYNNQLIEEHSSHDDVAVQSILKNAQESFEIWRKTSISDRSGLMVNAGKVLLENKDEYAQM